MKLKTLLSLSVVSIICLTGCSLGMTPTTAPSAPPQVVASKNVFEDQAMVGVYESGGLPQMFLWPTQKVDANGELVPLTFAEKARSRQEISTLADAISTYAKEKNRAIADIESQFAAIASLQSLFADNKCYKYCDENDFLSCDPTNECSKFNETWKAPENEVEEKLISQCQNYQADREKLQHQKDKMIATEALPYQELESEASLALLELISRGHFQELKQLKMEYDPKLEESSQLKISLTYGSLVYSTQGDDDSIKIRNVKFDKLDGYLSFEVQAIDLETLQTYGLIAFDLELTAVDQALRVDGNIELIYDDSSKEPRLGRFSDGGNIRAFDYVAPKCEQ